jgi:hypothetical protein
MPVEFLVELVDFLAGWCAGGQQRPPSLVHSREEPPWWAVVFSSWGTHRHGRLRRLPAVNRAIGECSEMPHSGHWRASTGSEKEGWEPTLGIGAARGAPGRWPVASRLTCRVPGRLSGAESRQTFGSARDFRAAQCTQEEKARSLSRDTTDLLLIAPGPARGRCLTCKRASRRWFSAGGPVPQWLTPMTTSTSTAAVQIP